MKLKVLLLISFLMIFSCYAASAQQQEEQPDIFEQAEMEADRLQRVLDLEDWQVFYVDSTLKVNYAALQAEYESLQKSKVTNMNIYQEAYDKCQDRIEAVYKKYFTEKQWAAYLKNGAAKAQKQRAKRREKARVQ